MILRGLNRYSSQDESESENVSEESNESKIEDAHPCHGDILMVRRILNNQPSPQALTQRENIFHKRCKILENICSRIMDSESSKTQEN